MPVSSIALLALLAVVGASDEVTEVKPKNIDISLSARWPASPAAVEAAEFMTEEDSALFWRFAEGMSEPHAAPEHVRAGSGTDREHFDHVLGVASKLLSELGVRVLKAFLAAHVLSPRAEMWRQLAENEAEQLGVDAGASAWLRSCGRALAIDAGTPPKPAIAALVEQVTGSAECAVPAKAEERAVSDNAPLAPDHVYGGGGGSSAPMVVLYAPLGSAAFGAAHNVLAEMSRAGVITYVYRPLWRAAADAPKQTLQGYGVQLAIKNMEYKAMDDKQIKDLGGIGEDSSAGADGEAEEAEEEEQHGFYFATLKERRPELDETLKTFRETLAASQGSQDASKLKVWALQDLGVQASSRVLKAKDPLRALVELSQNFPFLAPSLTKAAADRKLEDEVENLQNSAWGPGVRRCCPRRPAQPTRHSPLATRLPRHRAMIAKTIRKLISDHSGEESSMSTSAAHTRQAHARRAHCTNTTHTQPAPARRSLCVATVAPRAPAFHRAANDSDARSSTAHSSTGASCRLARTISPVC